MSDDSQVNVTSSVTQLEVIVTSIVTPTTMEVRKRWRRISFGLFRRKTKREKFEFFGRSIDAEPHLPDTGWSCLPTYLPTYLWLNRSIELGYNWSIECYRICVIICWNSKGPNFTQKLPKKWLKQFFSLIMSFFIISEKVGKYFAYFCKKICYQYCLKVAQSAHTE